jgi:hypothetical protein
MLPKAAPGLDRARSGACAEPTGGEHPGSFCDHGNIFIKISSGSFALQAQQVMGSGIIDTNGRSVLRSTRKSNRHHELHTSSI